MFIPVILQIGTQTSGAGLIRKTWFYARTPHLCARIVLGSFFTTRTFSTLYTSTTTSPKLSLRTKIVYYAMNKQEL